MININIDEFWNEVFGKLNIIESVEQRGYFYISRTDCSTVTDKNIFLKIEDYFIFRTFEQLPKIFKENKLTIVQTFKSNFMISYLNDYFRFDVQENKPLFLNYDLRVLSAFDFAHDGITLGLALLNSGIFDDLIVKRDTSALKILNIASSTCNVGVLNKNSVLYNKDSLDIKKTVKISNVRLVYDFICEDNKNIFVFIVVNELLSSYSKILLHNINVRLTEITEKPITLIILARCEKSIMLYELFFEDNLNFDSLVCRNEVLFTNDFVQNKLKHNDNLKTKRSVDEDLLGSIPFPQANDINKVLLYCDLIFKNKKSTQELVELMGVTSRQVKYYKNSCSYLGLIIEKEGQIFLTEELYRVFENGDTVLKEKFIIKSIMDDELLKQCYLYHITGELNLETFRKIIEVKYEVSEETYKRRYSTIRSWFKWIDKILDKNKNYSYTAANKRQTTFLTKKFDEINRDYFTMNEINEFLMSNDIEISKKDLLKELSNTDHYFSEELQMIFRNKNSYYEFLKSV